MNASIWATSTRTPLMSPTPAPSASTTKHRERPGNAELGLQADRQDVPQHDAVADRQIDLAGDHRDHRAERQDGDDRLVGDDRTDVEQGRERVRQKDAEQEREQRRSG